MFQISLRLTSKLYKAFLYKGHILSPHISLWVDHFNITFPSNFLSQSQITFWSLTIKATPSRQILQNENIFKRSFHIRLSSLYKNACSFEHNFHMCRLFWYHASSLTWIYVYLTLCLLQTSNLNQLNKLTNAFGMSCQWTQVISNQFLQIFWNTADPIW